ncbi:MAG: 16S rRNA (guanine(966)-N(2))-methyltransferase RsmD [Streptosporangiales bacterium]|nr:16S rRNA (guanine(966)-N(2))-methyltransferase RsmD [Streptosporangiales bacterium]
MTRVIAGAAGGRRLTTPPGRSTRPTSDRTREGFFATVGSLLGSLAGMRVLDLYAGSGAVGLEALSRGAEHVLLVESNPRAARTIRANIRALDLPGAQVVCAKVESVLARPCSGPGYDLAFADPPYATEQAAIAAMLRALRDNGWLAPGALVALERPSRGAPPAWPEGHKDEQRPRRYGDATLWYGHAGP